MAVLTITKKNFHRMVLESEMPVVVDFSADWCAPCRQVAPALKSLSDEYRDAIRFVKIDVDRNQEIAAEFGVRSIPAIGLFVNGKSRHWTLGAKPAHVIEAELGLEAAARGEVDDPGLLRRVFRRR